jgi:hypothetical protein
LLGGGPAAHDRHNGALLGIEEAQQAAQLFGGRADLVAMSEPDRIPVGLAAIIGDEQEAHYRLLAHDNEQAPLVMNVACASDALRGVACATRLFHVYPSAAMNRDARSQVPGSSEVVAWDTALVRFGADTLNGRFEKRFGMPMTPQAWAAWFSVKAPWESVLRMKSAKPAVIAEYLVRDTTQFDGHKGRPLSFRPWDRQLRQFLYARVGGKFVDVPQNAPQNINSRTFLDRLGTSAAETECRSAL